MALTKIRVVRETVRVRLERRRYGDPRLIGLYGLGGTVFVSKGSRLVGEGRSEIMGSGNKLGDEDYLQFMFK
jgi:hypothetical protein